VISKSVWVRAKKIRLLATDVDGVLTGGEIIILNSGEELKIWSVKDRMGFALLKHSGAPIKTAWVTARQSEQVKVRGEDLGIHFIRQGCMDKRQAVQSIARTMNISPSEIAYVGDDYVDYTAMKMAGLAVCPPQSPDLIKKASHYRTRASAGKGVLREVIEILLKAQGHWEKALLPFVGRILLVLCLPLSCWTSHQI